MPSHCRRTPSTTGRSCRSTSGASRQPAPGAWSWEARESAGPRSRESWRSGTSSSTARTRTRWSYARGRTTRTSCATPVPARRTPRSRTVPRGTPAPPTPSTSPRRAASVLTRVRRGSLGAGTAWRARRAIPTARAATVRRRTTAWRVGRAGISWKMPAGGSVLKEAMPVRARKRWVVCSLYAYCLHACCPKWECLTETGWSPSWESRVPTLNH